MLMEDRTYPASEQRGNPTYTVHLAKGIVDTFLSGDMQSGIYHLTNACENERGVSRYEIAYEISRILKKSSALVERVTAGRVFKTPRPQHAALLSTKLPPLPNWRVALKEYIEKRYGLK